ncbi:hypothetical protein RRG08_023725 [Elysia crispata]|uniref:Fidgetin-like protein 1 n=1 Tax=Elysia crispata TaxID=231223 RepID=A0AAE0Z0H4_9GAST|nr:hypothetical protein RRG08_023725 [Elysia crispata]
MPETSLCGARSLKISGSRSSLGSIAGVETTHFTKKSMDFSAAAGDFLSRHQQLEFSCCETESKKNPSRLADNLRNLYLHHCNYRKSSPWICHDSNSKEPESLFSDAIANEYLKKYTDVVDNMDTGGLNNFAEGALALCQFYKNDSSKWRTSLTEEEIMQHPCVLEALAEHESGSESDDFDIPLNVCAATDRETSSGFLMQDAESPPTRTPSSGASSGNKYSQSADTGALSVSKPNVGTTYGQPSRQQQNFLQATALHSPRDQQTRSARPLFSSAASSLQSETSSSLKRPLYQEEHSTSVVDVQPSRVGGPYSNFGQKQKSSMQALNQNYKARKPWWNKRKAQDEEEDAPDDAVDDRNKQTPFRTARDQLLINQQKKGGGPVSGANYGAGKKSLGTRRGPASKFVPPVLNRDSDQTDSPHPSNSGESKPNQDEPVDERLKGIDPKMIELINNEIMDNSSSLTWADIAGLEFAKKTIQEIVVWPMLRPDIFTGLRGPPKGLLLFGPPGTGKTLIGKCIASQSKSTFFCISASSLTSKWVGEGEKMVRTLFAVARCHQPAVIFIDEIDSLLSQRSDSEHESSRRIKTEFLVQLDGATTESEDRILVIGATNRPQEIDEAARRRFVKRLLIPLPEAIARRQIVINLLAQQKSDLSEADIQRICDKTDGYSGADMTNLCREAALGPIRSIPFERMETITPDQVRPIQLPDFEQALLQVRASVSDKDLELYAQWNQTYGSFGQ